MILGLGFSVQRVQGLLVRIWESRFEFGVKGLDLELRGLGLITGLRLWVNEAKAKDVVDSLKRSNFSVYETLGGNYCTN